MKILLGFLLVSFWTVPVFAAHPAPQHAMTLYGEAKYKPGFHHFDYVKPDAPIGGELHLSEMSAFDTVTAFTLKGVKAPGLSLTQESLMAGSLDEPQVAYPLIAQSFIMADDRSWAEFTLNPAARWADGKPITAEDVVFSLEMFKTKADPAYRIFYAPILKAEKMKEGVVRFTFMKDVGREPPLVAASMAILPKHYYDKVPFDKTSLTPALGSGPYTIEKVDAGRSITYKRNPKYWGWNLPSRRGQFNFERIRYDIYRDETVALEAFKAGEYDFRQEYIARNWATAYDSPAVKDGRIIKKPIADGRPQGMQAFLFNMRESRFADSRVRRAINLTLDFNWVNRTLFYDAYKQNRSFFANTQFEAKAPPSGDEMALLKPFAGTLPPELFTQEFTNPITDGSGNNRDNLKLADTLLNEAGWVIKGGKRVNAKTGEKLEVEFLLRQQTMLRVLGVMRKGLERLGIDTRVRLIDDAQYQRRVEDGDFDIISIWLNQGLFFPGNEQASYWHSKEADIRGSNNVGHVKDPVVDAMLAALVSAKDVKELEAAGRALDRVLQWRYFVIPHWHSSSFRVAYWDKFGRPETPPKYDVGLTTWWIKK